MFYLIFIRFWGCWHRDENLFQHPSLNAKLKYETRQGSKNTCSCPRRRRWLGPIRGYVDVRGVYYSCALRHCIKFRFCNSVRSLLVGLTLFPFRLILFLSWLSYRSCYLFPHPLDRWLFFWFLVFFAITRIKNRTTSHPWIANLTNVYVSDASSPG